jgi:hypothetical protein
MGLMDSLKKATGVGLTPQEHYNRAYEKGVLLGEDKYGDAVKLFLAAAKKADEAGDEPLAARARANAALYRFVLGKGDFADLFQALETQSEIEQVGSSTDVMETAPLLAELRARLTEQGLVTGDANGHREAAATFKPIFTQKLWTYRHRPAEKHNDTGQQRFFFHTGMASWHDAVAVAQEDPESAAEHMAKALNAYRQCEASQRAEQAEAWLKNCRLRRTCWMCSREFQGAQLHFRGFRSDVSPYAVSTNEALSRDTSSIDRNEQLIILCEPCGSALEHTADRIAQQRTAQLREELVNALNAQVAEINNALGTVDKRLRKVERIAHRH